MTDEYVPTRIRGGVRPSARDCFGCQDVEIRQYRDRKIRVCGISGTTFRQTAACPKLLSSLTAPLFSFEEATQ